MSPQDVAGVDTPAALSRQSQAEVSTRARSLTKLARASGQGALVLAAAQIVDMRVTGRQGTDTPVRAYEAVSHRQVQGRATRAAVGYAVQSSLGPLGAVAATLAGDGLKRRFAAAALTPVLVAGIVSPALGASAWPWRWTRSDWTRELAIKGVFATAVITAL